MGTHNKIKITKGDVFGYLTVLKEQEGKRRIKNGKVVSVDRIFLVKCECGKEYNVLMWNMIKRKDHVSCGCHAQDKGKIQLYKHGLSTHSIYKRYTGMIKRCYNKNEQFYSRYGGRGIKVCDEWKNDFMSFYNWAITNGYDKSLSLDRIDNNSDYEPSNCRFTNAEVQANNKNNNYLYDYNGGIFSVSQIARFENINRATLQSRLHKGVPLNDAIFIAKNGNRVKRKKSPKSRMSICDNLGINYNAINSIMYRQKISFEEAIAYYLNKK